MAVAARPPSTSKFDSITRSSSGAITRGGKRGEVAAHALLGGEPASRSRDRGDAPVPELEQVADRLVGAGGVRGRNGRDGPIDAPARVDDDEAEAVLHQPAELTGGLLGQDQQAAVGGSVDEALEQRDLPIVLVERRAEDDSHVVLVEGVGDAGDDQREVGGVDPRHRHPDQAGPPAGEAARGSVCRVAVLADDALRRPGASSRRRSRCR